MDGGKVKERTHALVNEGIVVEKLEDLLLSFEYLLVVLHVFHVNVLHLHLQNKYFLVKRSCVPH